MFRSQCGINFLIKQRKLYFYTSDIPNYTWQYINFAHHYSTMCTGWLLLNKNFINLVSILTDLIWSHNRISRFFLLCRRLVPYISRQIVPVLSVHVLTWSRIVLSGNNNNKHNMMQIRRSQLSQMDGTFRGTQKCYVYRH